MPAPDMVILLNASAWLRNSRTMTPIARAVFMDVICQLACLGPTGVMADPLLDDFKELAEITCVPEETLRVVWGEVREKLQDGPAGTLCSHRARELSRDGAAMAAMEQSLAPSTRRNIRAKPMKVVRYEEPNSDSQFRRFWKVCPKHLKCHRTAAWRAWCKHVSPMGQAFIEVVLRKWAIYTVSEASLRDDREFPTCREWIAKRGWTREAASLS